MPKEQKAPATMHRVSPMASNSRQAPATEHQPSTQRNAAVWNATDDETLLSARASGLNWQPIAVKYFPTKTANACRKRHERLMERRNVEDWDGEKLERLAREYMECRKEMWSILAARLGERWAVIEAKCMQRGLKNLQTAARAAQKRATADEGRPERGNEDHNSDSGIGCSDAEMEAGDASGPSSAGPRLRPLQPLIHEQQQPTQNVPSPLNLPLYQPPVQQWMRAQMAPGPPPEPPYNAVRSRREREQHSHSPTHSQRGSISIQSMLSPAEVSHA